MLNDSLIEKHKEYGNMKIVVNPSQIQIPQLSDQELCDLRQARLLLEQPTLAMRMTQHLGRLVERVMEAMPRIIRATIETSSVVALRQATRVATWTLNKKQVRPSSEGFHQVALLVSGGMGGTLGLATLIWELPLSTTLMLRSIADIARSEGHSLRSPETLTSCLEVFAMEGGRKATPNSRITTGPFDLRSPRLFQKPPLRSRVRRQPREQP